MFLISSVSGMRAFAARKSLTKKSIINRILFETMKRRLVCFSTRSTVHKMSREDTDKQNVLFTVPNVLTTTRIASIPFINYFVLSEQHELACGLFFVAGLTDFLDGYIARNFKNQKSYLGSILDPLADKLLIGSLTLTLTINSMLPVQLAFLILGRDLALILYSVYIRYKQVDKPVTMAKFLDIKHSKVQVEADLISKVNTFFQLVLITSTLPSVVFMYNQSIYLILLQYLTGFTTILSSISYAYKRGSYKIIDKPKQSNF